MKVDFVSKRTLSAQKHDSKRLDVHFFDDIDSYHKASSSHKFLVAGYLDLVDTIMALQDVVTQYSNVYMHVDTLRSTKSKIGSICMISKAFFAFGFTYKTGSNSKFPTFHIVDLDKYKRLWGRVVRKIESGDIARSLASEPSNVLYPEEFSKRVQKLFKGFQNLNVQVMNEKQLHTMGCGLISGVGQGAKHGPRMIVIDYNPPLINKNNDKSSRKTICLCGKGVCFDSGGYNIKNDMTHMHTDKSGASVVVGVVHYFASMKIKKHRLVGIIPLVENMVGGSAIKQSDILTAYNKKTVEVINTDAEGRLILADAIAYGCETFKPDYVFDFATLTGWASMLHCDTSYVFYTKNDDLGKLVDECGQHVCERSIRMPKWDEYMRYTKSSIADYKNAGYQCKNNSYSGSGFMAAMFLMNFVPKQLRNKWIHFDMTHEKNMINPYLANGNSMYTCISLLFNL